VRVIITNPSSTWSFIDEWEATGPTGPDPCATTPRFSGTFLQPDLADTWSTNEWDDELDFLTEACITDLVLQWTADSEDETTIYPTKSRGGPLRAMLARQVLPESVDCAIACLRDETRTAVASRTAAACP
jgi:hypothetical protein